MRRLWIYGTLVPLLVGATAACGSNDGKQEAVGHAASADTTTTYAPPPNPTPNGWQGTQVDLMVADAWTSCSYVAANTTMASTQEMDATDEYFADVATKMGNACATTTGNTTTTYATQKGLTGPFASWAALRADAFCYTATASQPSPQPMTLEQTIIPHILTGDPEVALRTASVNHCVAQRLRNEAPGASAGAALSMPIAQQMQLLQIIHERAQVAMLQYGMLGMAFTSSSRPTGLVKSLGIVTDAGQLRTWAEQNVTRVGAIGTDFAQVVELDLQATQDLAQLYADQGAADEAKAGGQVSVADAVWGKGSWRQRMMGLLYGGDPLVGYAAGVVGADTAPGIGFGNVQVYAKNPSLPVLDNPAELGWPAPTELPYAKVSATDPHVSVLLGLAQQLDTQGLAGNAPTALQPGVLLLKAASGTSACVGTDIAASASQLYRNIEAILRFQDCEQPIGAADGGSAACPTAPDASSLPNESTNYASFVLYQKHRITPAHAQALVAQLDDLIGDDCGATWTDSARPGAYDVGGVITPLTLNGASWRHIGSTVGSGLPTAQLAPRGLEEMAPLYARLGRLRMPKVIEYSVPLDQQGLVSGQYFNNAERKRALGAVEAFAATREALETTAIPGTQAGNAYLGLHSEVAQLISAAIGDSTFGFSAHATTQSLGKPTTLFGPNVSPRQPAIAVQSVNGVVSSAVPGVNDAYDWDVDVTFPTSDPFFSRLTPSQVSLVAVPNDPHAAAFARFPGSARDGKSLSSIAGVVTSTTVTVDPSVAGSDGLVRWHYRIALPRATRWTFLAQYQDPVTGLTSHLLASNVSLASYTETCDQGAGTLPTSHSYDTGTAPSHARPLEGQYLAFGGHLGTMALQTLAADPVDPTLPAFDALGVPRHFVPPPDSKTIGGDPNGLPLADYWIGKASGAASAAQTATQSVLNNLLKVATDVTTEQNAAIKSQAAVQDSWTELCGTDDSGGTAGAEPCDTSLVDYTLDYATPFKQSVQAATNNPTWDPTNPATCSGNPPDLAVPSLRDGNGWQQWLDDFGDSKVEPPDLTAEKTALSNWLDCTTYQLLSSLSLKTKVANPVYQIITQPNPPTTVPSFSQVSGGTLQNDFINQWTALQQAINVVKDVETANSASKAHLDSFLAAYQAVTGKAADNCSARAMDSSILGGLSIGISTGFASVTASVNMSMGPMIAQDQKCRDMKQDVDSSASQAVSNMWDAVSNTISQASKLTDAGKTIQNSAATIAQDVNKASIAREQAQLEQQLTVNGLVTSFGLFGQMQNQDVQEAQTAVNSARLYALYARRAVESEFVVDLSKMYANEAMVQAPYLWADSIYTMDLDVAAAAGIAVGTTNAASIYPYALTDYATNLQKFEDGFFGNRSYLTPEDVPLLPVSLTAPYAVDPTGSVSWTFFCPTADGSSGRWIQVPPTGDESSWLAHVQASCSQRVLQAKVRFSLDPWGRLGFTSPRTDLANEYNMRWDKFFVNIEGTSVCDPTYLGTTPAGQTCVGTNVVLSNLTQLAPVWTTDSNDVWTPMGFDSAVLTEIDALEIGYPFGINAWGDPNEGSYANGVTRHGLSDRGVGGFYELELNAETPIDGPEASPTLPTADQTFAIEHVDGVQIVLQTQYWQR